MAEQAVGAFVAMLVLELVQRLGDLDSGSTGFCDLCQFTLHVDGVFHSLLELPIRVHP